MTRERLSFRNLTDEAGESIDGDDLDQIAGDGDCVVVNDQPSGMRMTGPPCSTGEENRKRSTCTNLKMRRGPFF